MIAHERFLLAEHKQKISEAERRGELGAALRELRRNRPTLRRRLAGTLHALAYRLSPETMTPTSRTEKRYAPARGRC